MPPTFKRTRRAALHHAGSPSSYFSRRKNVLAPWLLPLLIVLVLAGIFATVFAQPTLSTFAHSSGKDSSHQTKDQGNAKNNQDNQNNNGDQRGNQNNNQGGNQNNNQGGNQNNNQGGNQNNNQGGNQNSNNNQGGNQNNNNNQNTPNPNCTLIIPDQPLTAQGLATPYQLTATDRGNGPCREANKMQTAFVQAAVLNPANGQISIYNPLVVDRGRTPAVAPVQPKLPQNAVVGIWFGFNGTTLTLENFNGGSQAGMCVNGLDRSIFGQYAYCNAPAFFTAANQAIKAGKLTVPALGTANDGMVCPTTRDFSVVDQDQSDNVTTQYLVDFRGQTAQATASNLQQLPGAGMLVNASDNGLLNVSIDKALNCKPWIAPDLANPGQTVPALPLNELQAAAHQTAPVALVPAGDPMTLINNERSLQKTNLYRAGVDQPAAQSLADADTATYCQNLLNTAPKRIFLDRAATSQLVSPDAAAANSLFTFLAQRFNASWTNLKCQQLTGFRSPIRLTTDGNNVTIDATLGNTRSTRRGQ